MDLVTVTFLLAVSYFVYAYFKKKHGYFEKLGIPYIPPVPLFGNMASTSLRLEHNMDAIKYIYNYNPKARYIGAFNFVTPVIVLRDPEVIKDVTIKHFENFMDRHVFVDSKLDPLFGNNLFQLKGQKWRETRNFLSPVFTSSKMKSMYGLMVQVTQNFMDYVDRLTTEDPKNEIFTKDLFSRYASDVVASCAFGLSIDSFKEFNNDFYLMVEKSLNLQGTLSVKFLLARSFPKIVKFLKIKLFPDHVTKFFEDVMSNTIKTREEMNITRPDMIQLMMDARGNEKSKLNISDMTAQAFVFFLGGFDTTKTQLCILAHELTLNQKVQKRLQDEIDDVLEKTKGKASYDEIVSMPYLDAVFFESMRKHPQGFILDRECVRDCLLPPALPGGKSVTVTPGMNLWIPVAGINYDEQFFDRPEEFNPERFFNKKISFNQIEGLGFGIGPRSCIGNRFAVLEAKILFFHLLAKYNLKPNSKTVDPLVYDVKSIFITPPGGYWLTMEPRKRNVL